ncbi:Signal recognition particle protein [Echinococcus granulosus]|uniref:Signal recognition particle 19 kDa protein n=1 Tax=Echinococcus granulosus TaxID=6210 RepID=U6IY89_ECHGR|nr:Signal recognition particle protein [Echinococcus granulosus]EUB63822.1 Signal recognition particle protein [Echinococcus granulosus]CDS15988.1 signal recognition particle 19 kDa protein [Echinococcus granulosus]
MASDLTAPKPFSPLMRHSDKERWICIYPVYLNSRVTRAKGRKVSMEQGVDNPKHTEICAILQNMGLQHLAENKVHSRERDPAETQNRWRVRVQLKNDDGSPCMPE